MNKWIYALLTVAALIFLSIGMNVFLAESTSKLIVLSCSVMVGLIVYILIGSKEGRY